MTIADLDKQFWHRIPSIAVYQKSFSALVRCGDNTTNCPLETARSATLCSGISGLVVEYIVAIDVTGFDSRLMHFSSTGRFYPSQTSA